MGYGFMILLAYHDLARACPVNFRAFFESLKTLQSLLFTIASGEVDKPVVVNKLHLNLHFVSSYPVIA